MRPRRKIGIIAGGGLLPRLAADTALEQGTNIFVIVLDGHGDPSDFADVDHAVCRLGAVGTILTKLHAANVEDVCMIGTVRRPSLAQLRPDARALGFIARYGFSGLGDDALLRSVGDILSREGMRIIGVQDIVGGILLNTGPIGDRAPSSEALSDIERGFGVARQLGLADVGQSVVVQQGVVLAVEAIEGTDRLIRRVGDLVFPGRGPILVKACKPQQDNRLDLPTIGSTTLESAVAAGFDGIAAEAGRTLVADIDALRTKADESGLFVYGIDGSKDLKSSAKGRRQ